MSGVSISTIHKPTNEIERIDTPALTGIRAPIRPPTGIIAAMHSADGNIASPMANSELPRTELSSSGMNTSLEYWATAIKPRQSMATAKVGLPMILRSINGVVAWRAWTTKPAKTTPDATSAITAGSSTAIRQVARLVQRGYVTRGADPSDGRAIIHSLTDEGRELLDRLGTARHEWFDDLLAEFDPLERRQLADLLGRLVERVREMT